VNPQWLCPYPLSVICGDRKPGSILKEINGAVFSAVTIKDKHSGFFIFTGDNMFFMEKAGAVNS
jgi:hypothetical protein